MSNFPGSSRDARRKEGVMAISRRVIGMLRSAFAPSQRATRAAAAPARPMPADALRTAKTLLADEPVAPIHSPAPAVADDGAVAGRGAFGQLRVAAVMDEFTETSFRPDCRLMQLSVGTWYEELEAFRPELLFVESAWRGKDGQWDRKVYRASPELLGVLAWCRDNGVPTVFWNKEDPVHFDGFINTARQFDWIFTTDVDCIPRYMTAVGHRRVHVLPFACQPATTHPIETFPRERAVCFAGSYYVKYPERTRDLAEVVRAFEGQMPIVIYDRYHGDRGPQFRFPDEYRPFIVGSLPFAEIDRAYKGYRYAMNLNTVKQSQTMCARRIFELLASNTVTVSNFSRAVRSFFGDLVIASDDRDEILRRLRELEVDGALWRKFRLAGLRKAMHGHTYQDRLATILSKTRGVPPPDLLPGIVAIGRAANEAELAALLAGFRRQSYARRRLVVVVPPGFVPRSASDDPEMRVVSEAAAAGTTCGEMTDEGELIAGMVPADYYGASYLLDLALATRYSSASAIGKAAFYAWSAEAGCRLDESGPPYKSVDRLAARRALVRRELVLRMPLAEFARGLANREIVGEGLLSVDEFSYCESGGGPDFGARHAEVVDDLAGLDHGISASQLSSHADDLGPEPASGEHLPARTGAELAMLFTPPEGKGFAFAVHGSTWQVVSTLAPDQIRYVHATTDLTLAELGFERRAQFRLDADPGMILSIALTYLDRDRKEIERVVREASQEGDFVVPPGAEWIRFGIRLQGGGSSRMHRLRLGPRPPSPVAVASRNQHLVIARQYPSYDSLYRFAFVHTRVAGYARRGLRVDVFRLQEGAPTTFGEYRNQDVITGSSADLQRLLAQGHHRSLMVHFLDEAMWNVLRNHVETMRIHVWVHGFEIQPWHRRDFNNDSEQRRQMAQKDSAARMAFWRQLLSDMPANLRLVFVSRAFAEEVMEDLGFRIPPDRYEIIHNPIDTGLFAYHPKPPEQRKKILSISSYASRKYANDLSVQAIRSLADRPWFGDLEFRLVGDGPLFEDVVKPLRDFGNVVIERRFLTPDQLRDVHRSYGVFLCPSRFDSHGVSRDEAMSSGLVPVTHAVSAIPEFVDSECGFLAPPEDFAGLAAGIEALYLDESLFARMSWNASRRVRRQSDIDTIVARELAMLRGDPPTPRS